MKKKIMFLGVLLLSFVLKIDGVHAKTCEYEMYPTSYYMNGAKVESIKMQKNPTMKVKVVYKNGTSAKVTVSSSLAKKFEKSFSIDSNLAISLNDGKCPKYIKVSTTGTAENVKKGTDFFKMVDKLLTKDSGATKKNNNNAVAKEVSGWIPAALVKNDGKVDNDAATTLANYIISKQAIAVTNASMPSSCSSSSADMSTYGITTFDTFLGYVSGNYSNRVEKDKNMTKTCWDARLKYVSAINNANMVKSEMEKTNPDVINRVKLTNQSWTSLETNIERVTKGSKYFSDQKTLEQTESKQQNAAGDYCYFYCENTKCSNQTNSIAKTECVKACNNNEKKKCDQSYDACKNVGSSEAQAQCIKGKLQEAGLDPSYTETRTEEMNKINEEIQKLRTQLSKVDKPSLNINFNSEGYRVQCSDVAFLHIFWVIIEVSAPILTILMGSIDFITAIIASDENKMQKARKKFPKRLLAAILLALSFYIISWLLTFTSDSNVNDTSLIKCIVSGQ